MEKSDTETKAGTDDRLFRGTWARGISAGSLSWQSLRDPLHVPGSFCKKGEAKIPAKVLRERLPRTLELVEERERRIYKQMRKKQIDMIKKSFVDFVKLCEQKEKQTKESCTIIADY